VVATLLRFVDLGRLSLWYDEVVTMRIAREPNPLAALRLSSQIDASRGILHPLLLQGWLRLFGTSDAAGRAFSALCGVATVFIVYRIGRRLWDRHTRLWAAWLVAVRPLLVQYWRETRRYGFFALLAGFGWGLA